MKQILYIGNRTSLTGGTPTSIELLAPKLEGLGFEVLTASGKKNKILRLLDMLWLVLRKRKTADYVLIDTYSTQNFWYASLVAKLSSFLKLKYIPILHGGELPERLEKSKHKSRVLFQNAHVNVAPSLYIKVKFQQYGFSKVKYIPNHIELDEYTFKEREFPRPKLLWVRSFSRIYNPLLAVQVLEKLLNEYPMAELCMIGPVKDDSYKDCLRYARSRRLPVLFKGRLTKKEWAVISEEYDIFLNTTHIDNSPVSIIEAMALGLPVVSTNVGGLPYLITADLEGILVPPDDPEKMLAAIHNIINNPQKSVERTRAARRKIEAFDWQRVKTSWQEILQ